MKLRDIRLLELMTQPLVLFDGGSVNDLQGSVHCSVDEFGRAHVDIIITNPLLMDAEFGQFVLSYKPKEQNYPEGEDHIIRSEN